MFSTFSTIIGFINLNWRKIKTSCYERVYAWPYRQPDHEWTHFRNVRGRTYPHDLSMEMGQHIYLFYHDDLSYILLRGESGPESKYHLPTSLLLFFGAN